MSLEQVLWFIGFIICLVSAFTLWKNGDAIRNSRYWAAGFFGYLTLIIMAAGCYGRTGLPVG